MHSNEMYALNWYCINSLPPISLKSRRIGCSVHNLRLLMSSIKITTITLVVNLIFSVAHKLLFHCISLLQTHPSIDKKLFQSQGIIAQKDKSKSFPLKQEIGVLRWRLQTTDESIMPLTSEFLYTFRPQTCVGST